MEKNLKKGELLVKIDYIKLSQYIKSETYHLRCCIKFLEKISNYLDLQKIKSEVEVLDENEK